MSPLFCLVFPLLAYAQSVAVETVTSTDVYGSVYTSTIYADTTSSVSSDAYITSETATSATDYGSSTGDTTGTTDYGATTSYPVSVPAIQTVPFTGQALLVGTCGIARFTMLTFPDGGSIEVPLVGCSDDRPECCPSLNFTSLGPEETGSSSESSSASHEAATSWTGTTPSPLPTGILSMLSRAPLTVCPSDMVDIDPVCCPSGFQVYGQVLVGNYPPCVSTLTVAMTPDSEVLASITSAVAASLATATTTTTAVPTVSVVITQVFALGLPCAEEDEESESNHTHLSTGAKAGIGAGAGILVLLIVGFLWACLAVRHRRRKKMKALEAANTAAGGVIRPESTAYTAAQGDPKHMSVNTSGMTSPVMQQQQPPWGTPTQQGFSPAFGYGAPQMQGPMVQHDPYGRTYGIQPMGPAGYPPMAGVYPQSQSPPPPFYPSGGTNYDYGTQYYKPPPAEFPGDDAHAGRRPSMGMSETQSQVTSTTAVTGSQRQEAEHRPPAELSSHQGGTYMH